jgi:protein-tyrosine phosphatase
MASAEAGVLFHCAAGKDRTGIAAALVLLALGVSRDAVRADYLLTNELVRDPAPGQSATPLEARAVLWRVQEGFLDTALDIVDTDHGGIERYLTQRLRLTPAALRALATRYLQPSDTS